MISGLFGNTLSLFENDEISIPAGSGKTIIIDAQPAEKTTLSLFVRNHRELSDAMVWNLKISVNGVILDESYILNKPIVFKTDRFPDGRSLFERESFFIVSSPSFEPITGKYIPQEYNDEQMYEYVFLLDKIIKPGANHFRIANSSRSSGDIMILRDVQISGKGLKHSALQNSVSKKTIRPLMKTNSIFAPRSKLLVIQSNLAAYEWAVQAKKEAIAAADERIALGLEFWWRIITSTEIPRVDFVNQQGCPACGKAMFQKYNYRGWIIQYTNSDFKITCPNCGERFPKNDFAAFYQSGLDSGGVFRYDLADQSLLYNTDFPDPGHPQHKTFVDDGTGFESKALPGTMNFSVAYYNLTGRILIMRNALDELSRAFLFTSDKKYARTAYVIIDRLADLYPHYDHAAMKNRIPKSRGGSVPDWGVMLDYIWENWIAQSSSYAYDVCYEGAKNDQELLNFYITLRKKFKGLSKKESFNDIVMNIQKNLIHEIVSRVKKGDIYGNEGFYQKSILQAGLVSGNRELFQESQDFCMNPFRFLDEAHPDWQIHKLLKGSGLPWLFFENINGAGMAGENAMTYQTILPTSFIPLIGMLKESGIPDSENVFLKFPIMEKFCWSLIHYNTVDNGHPAYGDSGGTGNPGGAAWYYNNGKTFENWQMLTMYSVFNNDIFLRFYYKFYLDKNGKDGVKFPIDTPDSGMLHTKMKTIWNEKGWPVPRTSFLPYDGALIVRFPDKKTGKISNAFYIRAGGTDGHGHADAMNIGIFHDGIDLMPDHGYPEFTGRWPHRIGSTRHTASHNTVMVNKNPQKGHPASSQPVFFLESSGITAIEFDNTEVTPAKMYRRTCAVVPLTGDDFYVFDLFRIDGGNHHVYSLHGYDGPVSHKGLSLTPQTKGTLAGENIAYGERIPGEEFDWGKGSGFAYFENIRKQKNPSSAFYAEWDIINYFSYYIDNQTSKAASTQKPKNNYKTGIKLRFTYCGDTLSEAVVCTARPPNFPSNPPSLEYLLLMRYGDSKISSVFAGVLEGYSGKPGLLAVKEISFDGKEKFPMARAFEVSVSGNRTDYFMFSIDEKLPLSAMNGRVTCKGRLGFISVVKDGGTRMALSAGSELTFDKKGIRNKKAAYTGRITGFSKDPYSFEQWIRVSGDFDGFSPGDMSYLSVSNDRKSPAFFKIEKITKIENQFIIHIGNARLVRQQINRLDAAAGFIYSVSAGDFCEITLNHTHQE